MTNTKPTSRVKSRICTLFTRLLSCRCRSNYVSTKPLAEPSNLKPGDIRHPSSLSCIFEPRIDVLERSMTKLQQIIDMNHSELTQKTANTTLDTSRILHILDKLQTEHQGLTSTIQRMEHVSNRIAYNNDNVPSDPVNIPKPSLQPSLQPPSLNCYSISAENASPASPTWYPVSAQDESSDEEDCQMGMVDA